MTDKLYEARDRITGLLDRDEFQNKARKKIRSGEFGLAIIWFNIDNFKIYNEIFGYISGTTPPRF